MLLMSTIHYEIVKKINGSEVDQVFGCLECEIKCFLFMPVLMHCGFARTMQVETGAAAA